MPRTVVLTSEFPLNDKEFVDWSYATTTTQNSAAAAKVFPTLPVPAAQMNPLTDAVKAADLVVGTGVHGAKPGRTVARNACEQSSYGALGNATNTPSSTPVPVVWT